MALRIPIWFFQIYLSATLAAFAFGPWPWPVEDPAKLYLFLLFVQLALGFGYRSGCHRAVNISPIGTPQNRDLLNLSLMLSLALLVPTCMSRAGTIWPHVMRGISEPGAVYEEAVERGMSGSGWLLVEYTRILLAPLLALGVPVVIVTWFQRSLLQQLAAIAIIVFTIALYISIGTNKAIFDTAVIIPWLMYLGVATKNIRITVKHLVGLAAAAALAGIGVIEFFAKGQLQRSGDVGSNGAFGPPINIYADPENWLSEHLSRQGVVIYESLTRYLGQGYYALSQSFSLPWHPTYGLGNSIFLAKNAQFIVSGARVLEDTYPGRLQAADDWPMLGLWHSIYPWIASDVGFPGTLLVIFVIGRYFAIAWSLSIKYQDYLSIALVNYFLIMLFYFPANNQLMQSGESCVGFVAVLAIWRMRWADPRTGSAKTPPRVAHEL